MVQALIEGTAFLLLLLLLVLAAILSRPASGPEPIYLKGGPRLEQNITPDAAAALDFAQRMTAPPRRTYFVAQYDRPLTASERTRLASQMNVKFLDAIPANSYVVSVPTMGGGPVMQRLLLSDPAARALVDIKDKDKLSVDLYEVDPGTGTLGENVPSYIESPGVMPGSKNQDLFVRFYADVPRARQRSLLMDYTDDAGDMHVDATAPSFGLWTVQVPEGNLVALAERPEIQSIEPAPPPTVDDMDAAKPWIDWSVSVNETGAGIKIGQWEGCMPDDSHDDLGNVSKVDVDSVYCSTDNHNDHATMVAGTIVGDGTILSNYKGVAEDAEILAFDTSGSSSEIIDEYVVALALGVTQTSNSFGFEYDDLFYEVLYDSLLWYRTINGHYDTVTSARTATGATVATGRQIAVVASTGNSGHMANWYGTRVRNSAKNVITVGGISTGPDVAGDAPMSQGGRGPTGDGRLSPLLVAPSIEHDGGEWGIKSTHPGDSLGEAWGTSFSAPIVSGVAALASEKFVDVCGGGPPAPADIRAVLVHTAKDLKAAGTEIYGLIGGGSVVKTSTVYHSGVNPALEYVGPDYIFGYGLVQAGQAVQAIGEYRFVRGSIEQGLINYPILLNGGSLDPDDHFKVTLAWDDPPFSDSGGIPSPATGFLQNDLDLVVIDPNGKRYYPWVLDKNNPGSPATQSTSGGWPYAGPIERDHRNTVEQIDIKVDTDLLGDTWTIQVRGSTMLLGPQAFTLVSKAIKPATDCGEIPSNVVPFPPQPPDSPFEFWLLIVALVMLAMLLYLLVRWVYFHYVQTVGPLRAVLMAFFALFIVLFVLFLLIQWAIVAVAFVIAFFLAYFYAYNP